MTDTATAHTSTDGDALRTVAIIMRSKDEQPYASETLSRLPGQTFQDFTLYNVDSGSTDGTLEAIQAHNPVAENLIQIAPGDYIPGRVLNDMIRRVSEPIIVLLNADCIPTTEDWLEKLVRPVLEGEADAVSSRQVARPDAHFVVAYDLDRAYSVKQMAKGRHTFFSAASCAFKRSVWEAEKFPEEGWGEDFVWAVRCRKQDVRFDFAPDSVVEHSHNYTLKTLYKRERGHGIVYYQMLEEPPALFYQSLQCLKHLVRDGLYALKKGRPLTIPYNIAYRATFHWAQYQGQRAGFLKQGFPQEFFRR